jgi:Putative zinc- or iron-chelating domain
MKQLNCGTCTVCCQGDLIFLKPGDDPSLYITAVSNGKRILAHKENGDCIYLDKGCTIHSYRPIGCRELDCRKVYKFVKRNPHYLKFFQADFMKAAKRAIKRSK